MNPLATAAELASHLQDPDLVLLDVRWALGRSGHENRAAYAAGHIPGAVFVDLDAELAGTPGPHTGRHPLPLPADFEAAARRWGINPGSRVVACDDASGLSAARAWWLLRHAGFERVSVLDGGLDAWRQAGGTLESGQQRNAPGTVSLSWGAMDVLEYDELEAFTGTLIDSRATSRYLGIEEPVDPVAGHIPGARNRPTTENLAADGTFEDAGQLRNAFAKLGAEAGAAAYCGSGVTAAHQVLAAASAGISLALYPGSFSQYCSYPQAPIATSDEQHRH